MRSFPSVPSVKSLANNSKLFCGNTESIEDNVRTPKSHDDLTEKIDSSPSAPELCSAGPEAGSGQLKISLLFLHASHVIENTGSVARDHLANERTWLAYIRTSLAISGTGIALVQLFTATALNESSMIVVSAAGMDLLNLGNALPRIIRPLGCAIVLGGLGILLMGIYRYFSVQNALQKGLFPTARCLIVLISAVLIAFIAINFALFLTIPD